MSRKAFFLPDLLPAAVRLAHEAGGLIMTYYRQGHAVDRKGDASPVTEADRAADRLIVAGLRALAPSIPCVSEEGDKPDVTGAEFFWLVDPLDGTKSFVRGSGYFTVNIGLIRNGVPVLGVIYDPVSEVMYSGTEGKAFRAQGLSAPEPIRVRPVPAHGLTALISHSHSNPPTEQYLAAHHVAERLPCASSIKFCWLAEGKADVYPRFGPTMEWDTAAGHAILLAAGGGLKTPENQSFLYGKPGFGNGNFIAYGGGAG